MNGREDSEVPNIPPTIAPGPGDEEVVVRGWRASKRGAIMSQASLATYSAAAEPI